jgi:hypothetical protein
VEKECLAIVEELTTAQTKEEATGSLRAIDIGMLTTLGTFARGLRKVTKMMVVHLDRLGPYH